MKQGEIPTDDVYKQPTNGSFKEGIIINFCSTFFFVSFRFCFSVLFLSVSIESFQLLFHRIIEGLKDELIH